MKILVTGGAGFIGSHLADSLLQEQHSVVVIDNLALGREKNLDKAFCFKDFKFIKEDLLNYDKISKIFEEEMFDIVFHLAANSDIAQSYANPDVDFNNTFMSSYNVLKAMKEHNVKKIVFASTSAIYGDTLGVKMDESYGPLFPQSHYGASKLASEAFISSFAENYDMQVWITRFPNVIGERATHGVIWDFVRKLKKNPSELEVLGDGEQNKPYLYVKDLVRAILFIWQNTNEKINFFNIGVDSRTKVKEIAEIVIKEMNLESTIVYTGGSKGWVGDVPEFDYDLSKIHNLGWKAENSSTEAVRKAVKYILEYDLCNL